MENIFLNDSLNFKIYHSSVELPDNWNAVTGSNIFLSTAYLKVLDVSAPTNMVCNYIGIFKGNELCGTAVTQFLDLNHLQSFGARDKRLKSNVRNFIFKNFNSHVLFVGNNMLTGQNAFYFSELVQQNDAMEILQKAIVELKKIFKTRQTPVHITSYKDFEREQATLMLPAFTSYYEFSIHPNMIFEVSGFWNTMNDYVNALSKKYRDQYKRSLKRSEGIVRRKMDLNDILKYEDLIHALYFHVARNAPFNTFFLAKNHFQCMKSQLGENFKFYGYFDNDKLIGFNTLIKNGDILDTYFLGYDSEIQREKMLYLNMLYDMIGYSIKKGFKKIVFARTALEIKSSIGANPVPMYGFLQHRNHLLQRQMDFLFNYFEPKIQWQQRSPFK